ncbi:MAG: hypothetical protein HYY49_14840 [Ignavibacteriales bacterium]|nr:hypothetical protein [Ignavibacteriales bacterium]
MKPRHVILLCCLFIAGSSLRAQIKTERDLQRATQGQVVKPEERVSFKSDMPYPRVIQAISELTKKLIKKEIQDQSPLADKETQKVDENIEGLYWRDALELILRRHGLWYLETADRIVVNTMDNISRLSATMQQTQQTTELPQTGMSGIPTGSQMPMQVDSAALLAKMREITISAIFLEINQSKLRETGISFSIFRGADLNLGISFSGSTGSGLSVEAAPRPKPGQLGVDISAAINFFENEQFGQVLSRPQVTVREGSQGRVQIGQSIGFVTKDFQGNSVTTFYEFGTILKASPKLYTLGKIPFIVLTLEVEKSTAVPGSTPPSATKTQASSIVTLLNGEETYLGGLYTTNQSTTREGIPLLKDLPWWFFGLRYLFGFDSQTETRNELIVLLKAELVPLIEERAARAQRDVLQERLRENQRDIDRRQGKKQ